jgi:Ribonuclease G/E
VFAGRVRRVSAVLRAAFLDLGAGADALLPLGAGSAPAEGALLEVEVVSAPRRGKSAVVRRLGPGEGAPRPLRPPPPLIERLKRLEPRAPVETGALARAAADLAQSHALAVTHELNGGGRIHVEPTRALVAVDVDLGAAEGEPRRAAARVNLAAVETCARVLRLKRLGGLVALDLVGKGHDGARIAAAARAAFAPDGAGVVFGPITRFGVFELAVPRDAAPLSDFFLGEDGEETVSTCVYRLLRQVESAAGPGLQVRALCGDEVFAAAEPFADELAARIGARFRFERAPFAKGRRFEVSAQ